MTRAELFALMLAVVDKPVRIKPLDTKGRIIGVWFNKTDALYEVSFYKDCERHTLLFREDEIEVLE